MNEKLRVHVLRWALFALLVAAYRVFHNRSRERVASDESLDDPDVAAAFARVGDMPQMRLLRRYTIQRALALTVRGRAADLGCGPGHLALELARAAPDLHITGIDLSDELLAEAREKARRSGLAERVSFKKGDAGQIPFADGSLDLVLSTLSLHHWHDPAEVLDEVARVLRSGGSFVIFDLRRDMAMPFYLLFWFVTRVVVPAALKRVNEPLGSRNAAYTVAEARELVERSRLAGGSVMGGPLWLVIEGALTDDGKETDTDDTDSH